MVGSKILESKRSSYSPESATQTVVPALEICKRNACLAKTNFGFQEGPAHKVVLILMESPPPPPKCASPVKAHARRVPLQVQIALHAGQVEMTRATYTSWWGLDPAKLYVQLNKQLRTRALINATPVSPRVRNAKIPLPPALPAWQVITWTTPAFANRCAK